MLKNLSLWILPIAGTLYFGYSIGNHFLGISPDSISYLSVAHHLAAGKGVQVFMENLSDRSHPNAAWPPLYPMFLALLLLTQKAIWITTWIFHTILFGLNLWVLSRLVYACTRSYWMALFASLVGFLDPTSFHYHSYILSEPLFLLLLNLSLWAYLEYFERDKKTFLVWSALAVGLASVTRYIGFSYVLSGTLCVFLFTPIKKAGRRLERAFLFGSVASVPFIYWAIRNYVITHERERSISKSLFGSLIHHGYVENPHGFMYTLKSACNATAQWMDNFMSLSNHQGVLLFLIFIFAGTLLTKSFAKKENKTAAIFFSTLFIHILIYYTSLILFLWYCHFDYEVPERYCLPGLSNMVVLWLVSIYWAVRWVGQNKSAQIFILLFFFFTGGVWAFRRSEFVQKHAQVLRETGPDDSAGNRWNFVRKVRWLPRT